VRQKARPCFRADGADRFLVHTFLIFYGVASVSDQVADKLEHAVTGAIHLSQAGGLTFVAALFVRAYALGGSTYSGVEAVSNNVNLLAEPRVETARRTTLYVALSLGLCVGGFMLLYSLWTVRPIQGQTLNATLFGAIAASLGLGDIAARALAFVALALEAAILVVTANSILNFAPSLLAGMAADSWLPHSFRNLSVRPVRQKGVLLVGSCALAILALSEGDVNVLIVSYSISVFLGLALANAGLLRHWWTARHPRRDWVARLAIAGLGLVVAGGIVVVTLTERFFEGGWAAVCLTLLVIGVCVTIRRHYEWVDEQHRKLDRQFVLSPREQQTATPIEPQRDGRTAVLLTTEHWGPTIHTLLWIRRLFPGRFWNIVLVRVMEIDGSTPNTEPDAAMIQLEGFCARNGLRAAKVVGCGTDPVGEMERLLTETVARFPDAVCFANVVILPPHRALLGWLHNQSAIALQRRLYLRGVPLVILPIKLGW